MGTNALRPDRRLETMPRWDEVREQMRPAHRTEWWLRGSLVGATPWCWSPRQAIRDGLEADEGYLAVLHRHDAA
jgi:hypothetical protein